MNGIKNLPTTEIPKFWKAALSEGLKGVLAAAAPSLPEGHLHRASDPSGAQGCCCGSRRLTRSTGLQLPQLGLVRRGKKQTRKQHLRRLFPVDFPGNGRTYPSTSEINKKKIGEAGELSPRKFPPASPSHFPPAPRSPGPLPSRLGHRQAVASTGDGTHGAITPPRSPLGPPPLCSQPLHPVGGTKPGSGAVPSAPGSYKSRRRIGHPRPLGGMAKRCH